jgi:hypothetical protein
MGGQSAALVVHRQQVADVEVAFENSAESLL